MSTDGNNVSAFEYGRLAQRVDQLEGQVRAMGEENEARRDSNEGLRADLAKHREEDARAFGTIVEQLRTLRDAIDGMRATVWKVVGTVLGVATLAATIVTAILKR